MCWSTTCKQLSWVGTNGCGQWCQNCLVLVLLQRNTYGIVRRFLLLLANLLLKWRILLKSFIWKNETKSLTLAWSRIHAQACQPFPEMVTFCLMPEREELNVILTDFKYLFSCSYSFSCNKLIFNALIITTPSDVRWKSCWMTFLSNREISMCSI